MYAGFDRLHLRVEVDRGAEYVPEVFEPAPGAKEHVVHLKRWIDMARLGWWSGDLHLHRDPADMPLVVEAADLHFVPDITKWDDRSNLETWPEEPLSPLPDSRAYSVDNAEDERHWGAALFFGLRTFMTLYPNGDWPPPTKTWGEARRKGAFIDAEKAIWWGTPVVAALIPPDSIGVANNHFFEDGMIADEAWGRPRDMAKYPGFRGFADNIFEIYYTYLSAGFRIAASAGSANGVIKNPAGYNRSYVYLGQDFSPTSWLAAQKAGRNFVTNGPMLFLQADGKMPGDILAPGTRSISVDLTALSRGQLEKVELIVNGRVVRTFEPGPDSSRIKGSLRLTVSDGDWLAARCFERNPKTVVFAHTSPIYVSPVPRRDPDALSRLRSWVEQYEDALKALPATALTDAQKQEWLALCRQAADKYR